MRLDRCSTATGSAVPDNNLHWLFNIFRWKMYSIIYFWSYLSDISRLRMHAVLAAMRPRGRINRWPNQLRSRTPSKASTNTHTHRPIGELLHAKVMFIGYLQHNSGVNGRSPNRWHRKVQLCSTDYYRRIWLFHIICYVCVHIVHNLFMGHMWLCTHWKVAASGNCFYNIYYIM